jgi:hypothetical protein
LFEHLGDETLEVIVGLFISLLASIAVPTLLEIKVFNTSESWQRIVATYGALSASCLLLPVLLSDFTNYWFNILCPPAAVLVATLISRISFPGVFVSLLATTILCPLNVLYQIAAYNGAPNPLPFIFCSLDMRFFAPTILGIVAYFLGSNITMKSSGWKIVG